MKDDYVRLWKERMQSDSPISALKNWNKSNTVQTKEIEWCWRGKLMNSVLDFLKSDTQMTYGIYYQTVEYINVRKVKCKDLLNEVWKLQEQFQCSSVSGNGYVLNEWKLGKLYSIEE